MSISGISSKIQQIRSNLSNLSVPQIQDPRQMFESILQEKLGTVRTEALPATAAGSEPPADPIEIFVENTITGSIPAYTSTEYAAGSYAASSGYCALCAAESAGYGGAPANTGLSDGDLEKAAPYMEYVNEASQRYGMPVNLILGIMKAESDFNNGSVSYAGAKGLMQLMPETAEEVGVTDVFDPRQNILGSVEYITKLINRYDGDVRLALAAYNTGPGKIAGRGVTSSESEAYLTVPQSIRDYADRVLRYAGYQG
jgi:soluble lytic murein transglycosylase-like protein